MARAGIGEGWECGFANDFDAMKASVYRANWGASDLHVGDVNDVTSDMLSGYADLVWASFPCQDLSLAGNAAGLGTERNQTRSGAFWAFWRVMEALREERRAPAIVVLENVYGVLTANGGRDFAAIGRTLALGGYVFGALKIDAIQFVPQSRARVFIVAVRDDIVIPTDLVGDAPDPDWHPPAMGVAIDRLAEPDRDRWRWLTIARPSTARLRLEDIIEVEPESVKWHTPDETDQLLAMMSEVNQAKLTALKAKGKRAYGTIYRRTRRSADGGKLLRAELRDDGVAGCLRTPSGGSSRQFVISVEQDKVRTRLMSAREAARLMGLPESYKLPARYNDAYHVAGDGLVVPVVRHLTAHMLEPIYWSTLRTGALRQAA